MQCNGVYAYQFPPKVKKVKVLIYKTPEMKKINGNFEKISKKSKKNYGVRAVEKFKVKGSMFKVSPKKCQSSRKIQR